jgi:hypothetical protein
MIEGVVRAQAVQASTLELEKQFKSLDVLMPGETVEAFGMKIINVSDTPIYHIFLIPPYPYHNFDDFHPELCYQIQTESSTEGHGHYLTSGCFKFYQEGNQVVFVRIEGEEYGRLRDKNKPAATHHLKRLSSRV